MAGKYTFPPGPTSTGGINPTMMHHELLNHREKYGKISFFKLGGKNLVSLNTMEVIREVLKSDNVKDRPTSFGQTYILIGDVAVQPYSEKLAKLKSFMKTGIRSMMDLNDETVAAMNLEFDFLKKRLKENGSNAFDPRDAFSAHAINGMLIGLVGRRLEYDHDIFRCFKQFEINAVKLFGDPTANLILSKFPGIRNWWFWYGKKYSITMSAVDDLARYLLHDTKKDDDLTKKGFIYEMLRQQKQDSTLTDAQIIACVLDMHIGGILTTTSAIVSFVYQLLCHPEIQTKVHAEIDNVIGKNTPPTLECLEKLPYTQAVMFELFRHCPILPGAVLRANENDTTVCGFHFSADTIFMPNLFGVNHDPEVWDDAWTFEPQRFLDESGYLLPDDHPTKMKLASFGDGIRRCPGESFARSRLLLYLVNFFQSFEVYDDTKQLTNGDPMSYTRDIILYAPPYQIKLRER